MAKKTENLPVAEPKSPSLALEKPEKGRSMWELLMQMRVLLPYLARLLPLLDGGAAKPSTDIRALQQSVNEMQTGNRNLEVQARNQALQMERMEAQMAGLRTAHENAAEETRKVYDEIRTLRRLLLGMGILTLVLLLITAGLVSFLLIHA
jgi:hypothetical protein